MELIYDYDTEFYEAGRGKPITWISIGIVSEDGRGLYLENKGFNWDSVPESHFIVDNVKPHLVGGSAAVWTPHAAQQIVSFITKDGTELDNELWAYYASYDHVVLAQIFGRMVDMPQGIPWFTRDIKQELERQRVFNKKLELPKQTGTQHHALEDARWNQQARHYLRDVDFYRLMGVDISGRS